MKYLLLFVAIITVSLSNAQTTSIPDSVFEQALIDLGYDDIIDGNVLTSNISSVTTLELPKYILNFEGIQDFAALEELEAVDADAETIDLAANTNLKKINLKGLLATSIDLSNNTELTEIKLDFSFVTELDLSQNSKLVHLSLWASEVMNLNIKNGNNTNLIYLDLDECGTYNDEGDLIDPISCITVDDPTYSKNNWATNPDFYFDNINDITFSLDCESLSVAKYNQIDFNLSPNPANDKILMSAENGIDTVTIYNLLGKEVLNAKNITNHVDVSELNSGVYFVKISSNNKTGVKKLIKN